MLTSGRISSCCSAGRRRRDGSSVADGNDYDESATTTKTTSRVVCANALLQIQDFNRGRYPTHSFVEDDNDKDYDDNATCHSGMRDVRRG